MLRIEHELALRPSAPEQNPKDMAQLYQEQLNRPIWPHLTDLAAPEDSSQQLLDFFHSQGIQNIRDLLLLDNQLKEHELYGDSAIRLVIQQRSIRLPWRLSDVPTIGRAAEMSCTLNEVPLQVALGGLFGSERHRLMSSRRVTVADALGEAPNFLTMYGKGARAAIGKLALCFADEFNRHKSYNAFTVEDPHVDGPPLSGILPQPLSPGAVNEHMAKFGTIKS